jgi:GH24 family phage-related lysozyme (muramidase)/outer membrane protein assembly factor BamD (BamD/ComL family)
MEKTNRQLSDAGRSRRDFFKKSIAITAGLAAMPTNISAQTRSVVPQTKKTGADWCKMELSNAIGVAVPLIFEQVHTSAKYTKADKKWNIGYSMTSMPADKKDPYGKWRKVKDGDTCTQDEAALWAGIYNQKYVYPTIKKLKEPVSFGMFLALVDFSYNNGSGSLGKMVSRLNDDWSEKRVLDKMLEYRYADGKILNGLIVRVWWRYMIGRNKCDYKKQLLDCKLTAVSHIGLDKLYSDKGKYKPILTNELVSSIFRANPGTKSVREIFGLSKTGKGYIAAIEKQSSGNIMEEAEPDKDSEMIRANTLGLEAQAAFDKEDFATAEKKFKELAKLAPGEYDSYNDLIFALYKLGKYDDGLKYARIIIDLAHKDDASEDKLFGKAYYNAGLCREGKSEYEMALKNYNTAGIRMPDDKKVKEAKERVKALLEGRTPGPEKTLLEEARELYIGKNYEDIIRKLTNKIGRSGLDSANRAIIWYILADALRREAITQEKEHYYSQAFNAYSEVEKTAPESEYVEYAEVQKKLLIDNGRVEIKSNGRANKGIDNYDPLPEDEWLKGKLADSHGFWSVGKGIGISAGVIAIGAALIGLNKLRERKKKVAEANEKSGR